MPEVFSCIERPEGEHWRRERSRLLINNYHTRRGEYGAAARRPRSARFPQNRLKPEGRGGSNAAEEDFAECRERSVCGMFGRQHAAVPSIFVENLCIPHGNSPAPRMVVIIQALADPCQIAEGGNKYHQAEVRLVRVAGRRNRPALPLRQLGSFPERRKSRTSGMWASQKSQLCLPGRS